jgi:hypothetical protein
LIGVGRRAFPSLHVLRGILGETATGSRVVDPATGKVWKAVRDGSLADTSAEIVTPKVTFRV